MREGQAGIGLGALQVGERALVSDPRGPDSVQQDKRGRRRGRRGGDDDGVEGGAGAGDQPAPAGTKLHSVK